MLKCKKNVPRHIGSDESVRRTALNAIGIVANQSWNRRLFDLLQLLWCECAWICIRSMLIEISVTLSEFRKLIGNDVGKRWSNQSIVTCRFKESANPQINVVRMMVNGGQFWTKVWSKFIETCYAPMAAHFNVIIIGPNGMITASLYINGSQI